MQQVYRFEGRQGKQQPAAGLPCSREEEGGGVGCVTWHAHICAHLSVVDMVVIFPQVDRRL